MNFKYMPELDFPYGYPMALALMFVSGLVPYLYFRRKGWL
jgi:magnesium transporter